jgi:hypothetical protein
MDICKYQEHQLSNAFNAKHKEGILALRPLCENYRSAMHLHHHRQPRADDDQKIEGKRNG